MPTYPWARRYKVLGIGKELCYWVNVVYLTQSLKKSTTPGKQTSTTLGKHTDAQD